MTEELISYIEKSFRAHPYRAVAGHSLAGLFVLNTLRSTPNAFDAYLTSSPALWWNDGKQAQELSLAFSSMPLDGKTLVVTASNEGTESNNFHTQFSKSMTARETQDLTYLSREFAMVADAYTNHVRISPKKFWPLSTITSPSLAMPGPRRLARSTLTGKPVSRPNRTYAAPLRVSALPEEASRQLGSTTDKSAQSSVGAHGTRYSSAIQQSQGIGVRCLIGRISPQGLLCRLHLR